MAGEMTVKSVCVCPWARRVVISPAFSMEEKMKKIISRRYYPYYYGRINTHYSWRSYTVGGTVRQGTADRLAGYVSDDITDGWIIGARGNPVRQFSADLAAVRDPA